MSSSWNRAAGMADKHASSNGMFVRLTGDGDRIVGAFCGGPLAREVIWTGERYETYDPDVHIAQRPSLRVMLNFYVPAERNMKVIEGGTVWFKDILKLKDKYGLEQWLFEIQRHGEAGNPKTKYTILPEEKLSAEQLDEIDSLGLHDLDSLAEGTSDGTGGEDLPIDADTAAQFVARLKALPQAYVSTFLDQFKVQRVRDLRERDVEAAQQLLGGLEARARRPSQPVQAEVDPFA